MTGKQFAAWVHMIGGADAARRILGISRATVFRLQAQGRVPRMVRLAIDGANSSIVPGMVMDKLDMTGVKRALAPFAAAAPQLVDRPRPTRKR